MIVFSSRSVNLLVRFLFRFRSLAEEVFLDLESNDF